VTPCNDTKDHMAKPKTVLTPEEFAALPEQITLSKAEAYAKTDDGFVLNVEPVKGYDVKPVEKLLGALGSERSVRAELEAKLKALGDMDPKAAREALATVAEWQKSPPDEKFKKQYESTLKQAQEEFQKKIAATETMRDKLRSQLEQQLVDAKAREAIAKHKGNVDLLLPHVRTRIKTEMSEAGDFAAFVTGQDGTKAHVVGKDGSLAPMSIEALVEQMRAQDAYAPAFGGTGATGGGTRSTAGGGAGSFTISSQEALSNPSAYAAVRSRAQAAGQTVQVID
jgi:flagellar biosynthesis/type III secretory pathway protein FliH